MFPEGFFNNKEYLNGMTQEQTTALLKYATLTVEYKKLYNALKEDYEKPDEDFRVSQIDSPSSTAKIVLEQFMKVHHEVEEFESKGLKEDGVAEALDYTLKKLKAMGAFG